MAARSSTPERRRLARRLAAALACLAACGLPRDPESTSEQVARRGLRVGVVLDPPWTCAPDGHRLAGAEVQLVRQLARALGVDVAFTVGGETRLLRALRRFELDLVIGGLVADNPHADEVGFTRRYLEDAEGERVFATPPGENAWTMQVEAFLAGADVDAALARAGTECGES